MKKTTPYLKKVASMFFKIIIAILMGIGSSLGNKPTEMEHKDKKNY